MAEVNWLWTLKTEVVSISRCGIDGKLALGIRSLEDDFVGKVADSEKSNMVAVLDPDTEVYQWMKVIENVYKNDNFYPKYVPDCSKILIIYTKYAPKTSPTFLMVDATTGTALNEISNPNYLRSW